MGNPQGREDRLNRQTLEQVRPAGGRRRGNKNCMSYCKYCGFTTNREHKVSCTKPQREEKSMSVPPWPSDPIEKKECIRLALLVEKGWKEDNERREAYFAARKKA